MTVIRSISLTLLTALPVVAAAQQQRPAIRPLGAVIARSTETVGSVPAVRHLSKAGVLVNDMARRRVVLFDSTLSKMSVVADSTAATASAYSGRMGGLIPYRGDSALFVDPTSLSMLVIEPTGKLGRVMSIPRSNDAMMLASTPMGTPGFDGNGRLVYRGSTPRHFPTPGAGGVMNMPPQPDSAPIVRIDLATRALDTITFVKIPKIKFDVTQVEGRINMSSQVNPLPVVDDWAVLSDGSVAVVRGQDYHVDIFGADGKKTSAPKMPFDWQRLSDEDKVAFIDSVKAARERMLAGAGGGEALVVGGGTAAGGAPGGGEIRISMSTAGTGGGGPEAASRAARAGGMTPRITFVQPSELPDYKPAFFAGSVRADADGNLWIRTIPTKAIPGGPVYDVVNARGELVDRVQIPAGRNIVGFGSGGVVYLTVREGDAAYLEKARVR